MGDTLKKVKPGDALAIPAEVYNAFIDAARDFQPRTRHVGQQATPGYRSAGIVLVKNESGADRLRFEVLGLADPIILPDADEQQFKNLVAFRGETPDETLHKGRFVILAEPVATRGVGPVRYFARPGRWGPHKTRPGGLDAAYNVGEDFV